jgi:hypothetical protein
MPGPISCDKFCRDPCIGCHNSSRPGQEFTGKLTVDKDRMRALGYGPRTHTHTMQGRPFLRLQRLMIDDIRNPSVQ